MSFRKTGTRFRSRKNSVSSPSDIFYAWSGEKNSPPMTAWFMGLPVSSLDRNMKSKEKIRSGIALLLTASVLTCVNNALAARPGDFRIIGPGGGGGMFHPTISPHDVKTVLNACDMMGLYITHDGGRSLRVFNLRGDGSLFFFDLLG